MYLLCFLLLSSVLIVIGANNERSWTYEPISVAVTTSDESKLKIDLRIVRVSRGVFALAGEIVWNYDVGDDTMVEMLSYRSTTGGDDYTPLPFSVPKQHFYDYINNVYKDVTMKNLESCSNVPQFEGQFQPPWPKKTYTLDNCIVDGEGLPPHLPVGFYKINGTFSGEVEWTFNLVAKIENKLY